jgi:hypothetical protein
MENSGSFKKGLTPWNKGKHLSEEIRKKISESKQNISEETRKKISNAHRGKHIGEKNPMFGKTHSEETRKKISTANLGRPSVFKGKHHSKETRKKMSEDRKGKLSGSKNPFYKKTGKDHPCFGLKKSEESRKKISETRKRKIASGEIAINKKVGKENPMFGKKHSDEARKKMSDALKGIHVGEDNPAWNGGTSFFPYCQKFNKKRRKAVREFFNYLCICTGEPSYTRELSVHHIDHDKEQGCNGKPFNLVPMNPEHHAKEQYNKEEYKAYINKTLREGFKWGIWNEQEYIEKVMY